MKRFVKAFKDNYVDALEEKINNYAKERQLILLQVSYAYDSTLDRHNALVLFEENSIKDMGVFNE